MDCCSVVDAVGLVLDTTFAFNLLAFCAVSDCALVCAMIGLNGDFLCDVCVDTSIFGAAPPLLTLLLLMICFVLDCTGDTVFGVFALSDVTENLEPRVPIPFGLDTGVGGFVMVVWFGITFDMAIGMGDDVFAFCVVCCTNCGVIVTPPDAIIGLTVMLLFTPAVTGSVFDDVAVAAAVVATLRAVTVSALFLLIAATASFVGSLCFAFDCMGLRIMAAIG